MVRGKTIDNIVILKIKDAKGNLSYEVGVKGKDVIFEKDGNFVKAEK
jgi:hypothetical protein